MKTKKQIGFLAELREGRSLPSPGSNPQPSKLPQTATKKAFSWDRLLAKPKQDALQPQANLATIPTASPQKPVTPGLDLPRQLNGQLNNPQIKRDVSKLAKRTK